MIAHYHEKVGNQSRPRPRGLIHERTTHCFVNVSRRFLSSGESAPGRLHFIVSHRFVAGLPPVGRLKTIILFYSVSFQAQSQPEPTRARVRARHREITSSGITAQIKIIYAKRKHRHTHMYVYPSTTTLSRSLRAVVTHLAPVCHNLRR